MRMPDTLKRLERIMGRKFTLEEHKRLTRIRDSLQLRDDDAVWTLFLALEYQRTFYTKLPDRIESLTTDLLKKVRETADKEAEKAQTRMVSSVIEQVERRSAKVHIHRLMPIYLLIVICLIFLVCLSVWLGNCWGKGTWIPFQGLPSVPAGLVLLILCVVGGAFSLGVSIWKAYHDEEGCDAPFFCGLLAISIPFIWKLGLKLLQ